jgi:hypothetical protein
MATEARKGMKNVTLCLGNYGRGHSWGGIDMTLLGHVHDMTCVDVDIVRAGSRITNQTCVRIIVHAQPLGRVRQLESSSRVWSDKLAAHIAQWVSYGDTRK